MRRGIVNAIVALMLVLCLATACGRARIIPKRTMAKIYAEMFLADQWLYDHPQFRKQVDTTLFYEPIFNRYGYTFKDFDASVNKYIDDPEKFSKVFRNASRYLEDMSKKYQTEQERIIAIRKFNEGITGYRARRFPNDSTMWRSPDSLRRDSLRRYALIRDSLIRDSLRLDSLRRDSLRIDSLKRANESGIAKRKIKLKKIKPNIG